MLTAASVLGLALAGQVTLGVVAAVEGSALMGWAAIVTAILTGTAAVIASLGTWRNQRQTRAVVNDTAVAVGTPNGTSLLKLANETHAAAERIEKVDTYLHDRMHEVIGQLGVLVAVSPTQLKLIEQLIALLAPKEN